MIPRRNTRSRPPEYRSVREPGRFAAWPEAGRAADCRSLTTIRGAGASASGRSLDSLPASPVDGGTRSASQILREVFGFAGFRPGQEAVIDALLGAGTRLR